MPPAFPIPAEQKLIRTFTGRAEQPIRTTWMKAAEAARTAISIEGLESFLSGARTASLGELRAVAHIDTMIGQLDVNLTPLLERLLFRSATAGEVVFAEVMDFPPIDLGIFRRDAAQAARTMVGDLIQGIETGRINPITGIRSRGQLDIVRDIIGDGFDLGRSHRASAHLIRDVIGLDDRRSKALEKYAAKLEAEGVPEAKRLRMIEAESRRKLQSRGLAVSRTESVKAASITQDMIWQRAVSEGQIPAGLWEQEWVASPNACAICRGLKGTRAPIGGEFPEPGGKGPPNPHTHCSCGRRIRMAEGATVAAPVPRPPAPTAPPAPLPPTATVPRFKAPAEGAAWIGENWAESVNLPGAKLGEVQDIADALGAVLTGNRTTKLAAVEWKTKTSRSLGLFYPGAQRLQIQKSAGKNAAAVAKRTATNWAANHAAAIARTESYVARLEAMPNAATAGVQAELAKVRGNLATINATERWAAFQDSERPLFSIVSHEAGHALMWQGRAAGSAYEEFFRQALQKTTSNGYRVSEYAATKGTELFAEITALVAEGRAASVPADLLAAWQATVKHIQFMQR